MSKYQNLAEYCKVLLFGIYVFALPISRITAVQSISLGLFLLLILLSDHKKIILSEIRNIKSILIVFAGLLAIAYLSVFYSVDRAESFNETNSELLKNMIVMIFAFLYFSSLSKDALSLYIRFIYIALCVHMLMNIYIWSLFDFKFGINVRMGGLLDGALEPNGGAGERFGIWITFFLAFAISLIYFSNKKFAILALFVAIFSIISNQTRATYVGAILMISSMFVVMPKARRIKISFFVFLAVAIGAFYGFSDNLSVRYNLSHASEYIELLQKSPNQMREFEALGLDYSIATRLSMWKSAILYRISEPFVPTGYGRFLYGKTIAGLMDEENKPFVVYAQVHNEFIGMLFSLGIFGFLLFITLWFYYLKNSFKLLRSDEVAFRQFGFFAFFGGIGFIGSLCFGNFFGDSEAKFFYLIFGMICGIVCNRGLLYDKNS